MVVEELEVAVSPEDEAGWLAADEGVWTAFLRTCPGFLAKEVWRPDDQQGVLLIQIWWQTREHWKVISDEQVAAVDARMGPWYREVTCREHRVVRTYR